MKNKKDIENNKITNNESDPKMQTKSIKSSINSGNTSMLLLSFLVLIIFILLETTYIVDQRQMAILTQFGNIIDVKKTPGLKFHIPIIQKIIFFDNRIQNVNFKANDANELVTSDQKTMRLEAYAKYKLSDPEKFYQTVRDEEAFKNRMSSMFESTLREVIGTSTFVDVLGNKRESVMRKISEIISNEVKDFGISFVDMRITRIGLPEKARMSVYQRMETDRAKEAAEIRAQGRRDANIIEAQTKRDQVIMMANAQKKANILRGEGDAMAARILLKFTDDAGEKSKEFYNYYRSLQAYEKIFDKQSNNFFIINTEKSQFFEKINDFADISPKEKVKN